MAFKKKIINTLPIYYFSTYAIPQTIAVLEDKGYGWYRKFEKRNGKANLKQRK